MEAPSGKGPVALSIDWLPRDKSKKYVAVAIASVFSAVVFPPRLGLPVGLDADDKGLAPKTAALPTPAVRLYLSGTAATSDSFAS